MCTAVSYTSGDHYFGRNLDLEYSYNEQVTVIPRKFPFFFKNGKSTIEHEALIGMAFVAGGFPLYYDAMNESGLGIAGLNFPGNCDFKKPVNGKINVASFEFIPYILTSCRTVAEVRKKLENINITDEAFSKELQPNPLHWMISDKNEQIVVEQTKSGLNIYNDPVGVMTNNPTFDVQMIMLANYRNLTAQQGENRFSEKLNLEPYSRGMGGIGLPGDLSSASRFAKVAFTRMNSVSEENESSAVSQFFHILGSVEQQRGLCRLGKNYEITIYSSCCNLDKGIYYYKTYDNSRISAVNMNHEDLDGSKLHTFDLIKGQQIMMQN